MYVCRLNRLVVPKRNDPKRDRHLHERIHYERQRTRYRKRNVRNADTICHTDEHTQCNALTHSDGISNAKSHAYCYTDPHTFAEPNALSDADRYAYSIADTQPNAIADSDADTKCDACGDSRYIGTDCGTNDGKRHGHLCHVLQQLRWLSDQEVRWICAMGV